jgi:adenylate cyclase
MSKAVVVVWSADAVKSQWVFPEANRAREDGKLVQLTLDGARLPMPFDIIQCADLRDWIGEAEHIGWSKVVASIVELTGVGAVDADAVHIGPIAKRPPPLSSKPSIAVLPFTNLSNDPDQDYFADGIVEELASVLGRFKSIFVIAGSSSLSLKNNDVSPQVAARSLGVRHLLKGSLRKTAGKVRIAVKPIDGLDGRQIRAERFDDTIEDLFELQDRLAVSVAGAIEPGVREWEIQQATQ